MRVGDLGGRQMLKHPISRKRPNPSGFESMARDHKNKKTGNGCLLLVLVNLGSMLTNEIIDQLVEVFKEWGTVFKAYPLNVSI